jgi:hypothetical protein
MDFSGIDLSDYGFDLKNRELAAVIWLGVIAAGLLLWKQIRPSLGQLIRAFFQWKLQAIFVAMTAYTMLVVVLMATLNLWEWSNLKTTLLWWITVGFGSVFEAQRLTKDPNGFRRLIKEAIGVAAFIAFIVSEFGSFPLFVELILPVPITFIALMRAMVPRQPGAAILIKPLAAIMSVIGFIFIGWSVMQIVSDPSDFWQWNTLREFGDPILLSIAFIPFLYALAILMEHESLFTSLKVMWTRPDLAAYAQRRSLWAFGHDLDAMRRLARDLKMNDVEDRQGVDDAIRLIRSLKRREKNPPTAPAEKGWSPHEAIRFLEAEGVVAKDWHPTTFGEWRAEASVVKLGDGFSPDNVSYFLSGNEFATTRMVLILHTDHRNDTAASDALFYVMVLKLLERAVPIDQAGAILGRLHDQGDMVIKEGGWRFSMSRDDWGNAKFGGYARNFKLTHPAHVPWEYDEEAFEAVALGEGSSAP